LSEYQVVGAYKGLQRVERAFRVLKNSIELRPIFVRKESRIRGHVMICFLAYLIEMILDQTVQKIDAQMSWPLLQEELARVKLIPIKWPKRSSHDPQELLLVPSFSRTAQKLYTKLGIRNVRKPQALRFEKRASSYNSAKQLSLFPSFSMD